jgi:hypothetical protein
MLNIIESDRRKIVIGKNVIILNGAVNISQKIFSNTATSSYIRVGVKLDISLSRVEGLRTM